MKRLLFALVAATALFSLPACSRGNERLVDVQIRDLDSYSNLQSYFDRNQTYIAGRPGHAYSVVLQNQSGERVLAVLSVDSVNAISGQTASASQTGYVLAPYQRMEIRGWRKSMQDIAQFRFTDLPDSYAARTGRPDNVGVIGVAVFRERRYQTYNNYEDDNGYRDGRYSPKSSERSNGSASSDAAATPAPSMKSQRSMGEAQTRQEIGTGHGERRYDPARQTTFERESTSPNQLSKIFYDSYEALVDRGIIRDYRRRDRSGPDAFPIGFVPDPYGN